MNIGDITPSKAGLEHVKNFNRKMEGTMEYTIKDKGHSRTTKKADTQDVFAGPLCPQCEIPTQLHEGAETCPVHGKVLIDEQ